MEALKDYQKIFAEAVEENLFNEEPKGLYEPINYLVSNGGKRLRPIITLISAELFGGDADLAVKCGLALEYFHNFTLIHDDIMDSGTMRRGKPAVHIEYGLNQAILSGDVLLVKAYEYFNDLPPEQYKKIVQLFTETAVILCEGQQLDMDFEDDISVTEEQYMKMIYYKTGALSAAAFKIGALLSDASEEDANKIFEFGKYLGIAFQLKDDLLDVYGTKQSFGKKHAGDVLENKKTILFLKANELANDTQKEELKFWYSMRTDNIDKVYGVEKIFNQLRVDLEVGKMIESYTDKSLAILDEINGNEETKKLLREFSINLVGRQS